jgi:hypothetical protein
VTHAEAAAVLLVVRREGVDVAVVRRPRLRPRLFEAVDLQQRALHRRARQGLETLIVVSVLCLRSVLAAERKRRLPKTVARQLQVRRDQGAVPYGRCDLGRVEAKETIALRRDDEPLARPEVLVLSLARHERIGLCLEARHEGLRAARSLLRRGLALQQSQECKCPPVPGPTLHPLLPLSIEPHLFGLVNRGSSSPGSISGLRAHICHHAPLTRRIIGMSPRMSDENLAHRRRAGSLAAGPPKLCGA